MENMNTHKGLVESFNLDHTKVQAPFIRLAGVKEKNGVRVIKFDIRFAQPNSEEIDSEALHTIEHIFSETIREGMGTSNVIDFSPMGCKTGFYLTVFETEVIYDLETAKDYIIDGFKKALNYEAIPAHNEIQCGNYKLHSLENAKTHIRRFLELIG